MNKISITTIIENHSDVDNKYISEHGLSLLIKTKEMNILFDTGQTNNFLENMKAMNIDYNSINKVILSHGHYDHTGGICALLEKAKNIETVYVGDNFFNKKYKLKDDNTYAYNGIKFSEESLYKLNNNIEKIKDNKKVINEELIIFHNFKINNDFEKLNKKFYINNSNEYILDNFQDEIALGIVTKKGLVLIVGCSHIGIINIINSVKSEINIPIRGIIGGTHLVDADKYRLKDTINELKKLNLEFLAVSHCTGDNNIDILKQEFKDKFIINNTGNVIEL